MFQDCNCWGEQGTPPGALQSLIVYYGCYMLPNMYSLKPPNFTEQNK